MLGSCVRWFVVVGAAAAVGLIGSPPVQARAGADTPVATLVEESKKQQKKVEEEGKKLLEVGKEYAAAKAANKPEADELLKKYQALQATYEKEVAALRKIAKELDAASQRGGDDGQRAGKERDEAIQSLGKLLGELIAQVLGAFLGGLTTEQRKTFLEASSKAVLGLPLSKEEIDALAKVPKAGQGGLQFDFYKEYSNAPNWPALRDNMVATAVEQLGKTTPVAQALDSVNTALKSGKKTPAQVAEAAKKPLPNGMFSKEEMRAKFLEAARMIAPPEVMEELKKIEVDQ